MRSALLPPPPGVGPGICEGDECDLRSVDLRYYSFLIIFEALAPSSVVVTSVAAVAVLRPVQQAFIRRSLGARSEKHSLVLPAR